MSDGLTQEEIDDLADRWYKALDIHAPLEQLLAMLADDGLEMVFPEGTSRGHAGFTEWYERVTRIFFDEVHTLKEVSPTMNDGGAAVKVVVNWQAKIWNPPAPKSEWLGFDAYQTWEVERSAASGQPVIRRYVVDDLAAMPGSASL